MGRHVLLRPRMLVLHVLVLAVVLGLVRLGTWQLSRHAEATGRVEAQQERLAADPVPVRDLLGDLTLDDTDRLAALEFRRVSATGSYLAAMEVLQRGRSHQGRAGFHVLTPLALDRGGAVLVRRGWVPFDNDLRPPVPEAAPPGGTVTVEGYLERSIPQPTGPVAQRDPEEGELDIVFHADLARLGPQLTAQLTAQLDAQSGGEVLPMLVHLEAQTPPTAGELPVPAPRPAPDRGPHLSYAIQWFAFALIGAATYAVWLRRRATRDERAVSADAGGQ